MRHSVTSDSQVPVIDPRTHGVWINPGLVLQVVYGPLILFTQCKSTVQCIKYRRGRPPVVRNVSATAAGWSTCCGACRIRQVNSLRLLEMDTQLRANDMDINRETSVALWITVNLSYILLKRTIWSKDQVLRKIQYCARKIQYCARIGVCKVAACMLKAMALSRARSCGTIWRSTSPSNAT